MSLDDKINIFARSYAVGQAFSISALAFLGLQDYKDELIERGILNNLSYGMYALNEGYETKILKRKISLEERIGLLLEYNKGSGIKLGELKLFGITSREVTYLDKCGVLTRNGRGVYTLNISSVLEYRELISNVSLKNKTKHEELEVENISLPKEESQANDRADFGLINEMFNSLSQRNVAKTMKLLHTFLISKDALEYERVVLNLMNIAFYEQDMAFTRVMFTLTAIDRGWYKLDIAGFIRDYYDSLLDGVIEEAKSYLDILLSIENINSNPNIVARLKKALDVDRKDLVEEKRLVLKLFEVLENKEEVVFDVPNLEQILEQILEYNQDVLQVCLAFSLNLVQMNYVKLMLAKEYSKRSNIELANALIKDVEKSGNKNEVIEEAIKGLKDAINVSLV